MAKVHLKPFVKINKRQLQEMSDEISGIADSSSQLIYIYSFPSIIDTSRIKSDKAAKDDFFNVRKANKSSKKWAVRVEGNSDPIATNFTSKQSAVSHANRLLERGLGKRIVVLDKV